MTNYNPNTYFDKFITGNQKPKLGIAISTYSEANTDSKRYEIIQRSFDSLLNAISHYYEELYIFIVVVSVLCCFVNYYLFLVLFSFVFFIRLLCSYIYIYLVFVLFYMCFLFIIILCYLSLFYISF